MDVLRARFEGLGFSNVETFIASGNVIFEAASGGPAGLQKKIEADLLSSLGYEVCTFLRTDAEVAEVVAHRPFGTRKMAAAQALNVAFLYKPAGARELRALAGLETPIDLFHAHGREVYWLCKKKQSESKFSNAVFEKTLGLRATFRNMNTVRRLAAKYPPR
jgi:uncharacterized protein (DUF1697 family)